MPELVVDSQIFGELAAESVDGGGRRLSGNPRPFADDPCRMEALRASDFSDALRIAPP